MARDFRSHEPGKPAAPDPQSGSDGEATDGSAAKGGKIGSDGKEPDSKRPKEIGGPSGPEPTRYGDWERKGICSDF